jgi:hypothetical protein
MVADCRRWLVVTGAALAWESGALRAHAQVRWDVAAEVGAKTRFTTGSAPSAPGPSFGPAFELQGHVALVPMLRVGAYLTQDTAIGSGNGTRTFWAGGIRAKVTPPLLPAPWRFWAYAGLGYAYAYAVSFRAPALVEGSEVIVRFPGQQGGILEVPVGVALGYRVSGGTGALRTTRAWVVFAELGGRFGVATFGPMYDAGPVAAVAGATAGSTVSAPFAGKDSFALSLSVGLSLQE